jgi:hypothetical protein
MLRATHLFFLAASLSIACEDPPLPRYAFEELSAVRDAAGRVEVRGVLRNNGGPQTSTVCVRVMALENLVVPVEGAAGAAPDDELVTKLLDAQERCYADGIDEDDAVSFAITMGDVTSTLSEPRIDVKLSISDGYRPRDTPSLYVTR